MNAKHGLLRWIALTALAILTVVGLTGCPSCQETIVDPDDGIQTERVMIVEDAGQPVWIGNMAFAFNYTNGGPDGIYMSDLDSIRTITELYPAAHNDDYVVSPSGNRMAFSTPDLHGGVYVVELTDPPGEPVFLLEGGKHPSFINDNTVVMENQTGQFGFVEIDPQSEFISYGSGSYPRASGDGNYIAYLVNANDLYYLNRITFETGLLGSGVATDHVWNPVEDIIYVSRLVDGTLTDVMEIPISDPESMSTLIAGAVRPSVSLDGNHFFVDNLDGDRNDGIVYLNLINPNDTGHIYGAQRPAAAPFGTQLLAEQNGDIYLITFE